MPAKKKGPGRPKGIVDNNMVIRAVDRCIKELTKLRRLYVKHEKQRRQEKA